MPVSNSGGTLMQSLTDGSSDMPATCVRRAAADTAMEFFMRLLNNMRSPDFVIVRSLLLHTVY